MERLSSLDGVFLAVEDRFNQMNIGTVAIFDGPRPSFDEVRDFLAGRIASVPRCRQRVREPAGATGSPGVDRRCALRPRRARARPVALRSGPGDLDSLVADLLTSPLDRSRPLWEVWVVDGLAEDRWAIVAKVHHCMVDGIAGNDLLSVILAQQPDAGPAVPDRWVPSPEPSAVAFAWFSVGRRSDPWPPMSAVRQRCSAIPPGPGHAGGTFSSAAKRLWYRQHRDPTSLTGTIGTHRRWAHVAVPFGDITAIRAALGGTVNDVVLAAVSSGFRDLLAERGETVEGRTITAMVPVSLRVPTERRKTGNRVANVHALLPMGHTDPRSVLRAVHQHLEDLKDSHEIEATGLLLRIGDYVPRVLADRVARTVLRRQRNVETVITNVPGPRSPLYLAGHRMIEGYPVAPIGGRVRISVAIWSYCDHLYIGITGDRDTAPDIERLGHGITLGFAGLLEAAQSG